MDHGEGVTQALGGTAVPQELLEEMLWVFRVEDASPWNISIFVLMGLVIVISIVLLERSIKANRNQKMQPSEKQTPGALHLAEAGTKDDNSLNILRETLLSEKLNVDPVEVELKERGAPQALLTDPQGSESENADQCPMSLAAEMKELPAN